MAHQNKERYPQGYLFLFCLLFRGDSNPERAASDKKRLIIVFSEAGAKTGTTSNAERSSSRQDAKHLFSDGSPNLNRLTIKVKRFLRFLYFFEKCRFDIYLTSTEEKCCFWLC